MKKLKILVIFWVELSLNLLEFCVDLNKFFRIDFFLYLSKHIRNKFIFELHFQIFYFMDLIKGTVFQRYSEVAHSSLSIFSPYFSPIQKLAITRKKFALHFWKFLNCQLLHLHHQSIVIQGFWVTGNRLIKLIFSTLELHDQLMGFKIPEQIHNYADNEKSWEKVSPYIDSLIMGHEEAFENFLGSVKADPIAMGDMLIVFHIGWSFLIMTDELILSLCFFRGRLFWWVIRSGVFGAFWVHSTITINLDKKWHHRGDK